MREFLAEAIELSDEQRRGRRSATAGTIMAGTTTWLKRSVDRRVDWTTTFGSRARRGVEWLNPLGLVVLVLVRSFLLPATFTAIARLHHRIR
jgi:hypothetical protein